MASAGSFLSLAVLFLKHCQQRVKSDPLTVTTNGLILSILFTQDSFRYNSALSFRLQSIALSFYLDYM